MAVAIADPLERATLAKVTHRLIPFLFLLYIVCFLDRVNIGFAALQMNHDLGLSPAAYGFGAGIFFVGYVACEVPSNLILARVGVRVWIARIMITWGLLAMAMMLVRGPLSLYGIRFLLGVAEAGFFPGIAYYLCRWFPAAARARAVAQFMIAIPLSGAIGGPVSGALLTLDGRLGLAGWQWLFLLEGLPAVMLGFVVLSYLTERPEEAKWLDPAERAWLSAHVKAEEEACRRRHGLSVLQALSNGTVWALGLLILLSIAFGGYVLSLWLPQIVKEFTGLSDFWVGVVSAVPNLVTAIAMVLVGIRSDRRGERLLHIAACSALAALGLLASAYLSSPIPLLLALSVAFAGLMSSHGPFWTLPSTFLTGSAAAGGFGLVNSVANVGGFAGPYLMGLLRGSSGSYRSGLLVLSGVSLAGTVLALRLRRATVLVAVRPAAVTGVPS